MDIKIDKKSGLPIYLQVKNQIKELIQSGTINIGYKMPAERDLSEKLQVSRNTISTAYKELEQEGILKSYQGRGTFVLEDARPWKRQNIREKIAKFVDLGFEEALEGGISPEEFLEIVTERVEQKKELISKIQAVYVECNIEQSKMFSKQLSQSTNLNVIPLTISDLKNMSKETKDTIEKSQVVIATFNHVNEVSELIAEFNKQILGIAINADMGTIVKIAKYPESTKFGFVCISEEFLFKVRAALETAGLGSLDITYSNSHDKEEMKRIVDESDVILVSPGRYSDIKELNSHNKDVISFIYNLDDGSVKALKSRLIELEYYK